MMNVNDILDFIEDCTWDEAIAIKNEATKRQLRIEIDSAPTTAEDMIKACIIASEAARNSCIKFP